MKKSIFLTCILSTSITGLFHDPTKIRLKKIQHHGKKRKRFTYEGFLTPLKPCLPSSCEEEKASLISKLYEQPKAVDFTYTNCNKKIKEWIHNNILLANEGETCIGFDMEAVPSTHKPATIQLATTKSALVVQLSRNTNAILASILNNPSIIKTGVGIDHDMMELYKYDPIFQAKSRFELGGIGATCHCQDGVLLEHERVGLKRLVKSILGLELTKSLHLVLCDWSDAPLKLEQIHYASRDAWAGIAILEHLQTVHHDLFESRAIMRDFINGRQRSIPELHKREVKRRNARENRKMIWREYREFLALENDSEKLRRQMKGSKHWTALPDLIKEEIDLLKLVEEKNEPDAYLCFDRDLLGL